jgi:uncharacterized protein YtpQ (UPF0354 family)
VPIAILKLEGRRDNGDTTGQISLERMFAVCAKAPDKCDAAMEDFSKQIASAVKERNRPIDAGMIRLVVRPVPYVERMRVQMGASPVPVYARPLVAGAALVPTADLTQSMRFIGERDLSRLGLTEEQLFALGASNVRALQRPLAEVVVVPPAKASGKDAVKQIAGDEFAATRLASLEDWRTLDGKLHHHLLVMIPSPDIVLYVDGSKAANVEALRREGLDQVRKSSRPLSSAVLRWTAAGWEEVKQQH